MLVIVIMISKDPFVDAVREHFDDDFFLLIDRYELSVELEHSKQIRAEINGEAE